MNTIPGPNEAFHSWCQTYLEEIESGFFEDPVAIFVVVIICSMITIITFVNNCIVFLALTLGRGRPSGSNISMTLTFSLVCADLLLSVTVMPISVYTLTGSNRLPTNVGCRIFVIADIYLCTVSIIHLLGLAVDRYTAICHPFFHQRLGTTAARIACVIVWLASGILTFPIFVQEWRPQMHDFGDDPEARCIFLFANDQCNFLTSPVLAVTVVSFSFVLPLFLIIALHVRIYQAAHARKRKLAKLKSSGDPPSCSRGGTTESVHYSKRQIGQGHDSERKIGQGHDSEGEIGQGHDSEREIGQGHDNSVREPDHIHDNGRETGQGHASERDIDQGHDPEKQVGQGHLHVIELQVTEEDAKTIQSSGSRVTGHLGRKHRERHPGEDRAMKTIVCLVLNFIVWWTPLFTTFLVDSCGGYEVPAYLFTLCSWLGYLNSTSNPVLYYCFNMAARRAIRRFLALKPVEVGR